jgi:signal transduction histidine kinase
MGQLHVMAIPFIEICEGTFRLTVSDTGIGIKADQIPSLRN